MNSNPTSGQISRSTSGQVEPEHVAPEGLSAEMSNLRRDVASLKDTFARLASQVGGEVAKTARSMKRRERCVMAPGRHYWVRLHLP
jgi:hypothetical protein